MKNYGLVFFPVKIHLLINQKWKQRFKHWIEINFREEIFCRMTDYIIQNYYNAAIFLICILILIARTHFFYTSPLPLPLTPQFPFHFLPTLQQFISLQIFVWMLTTKQFSRFSKIQLPIFTILTYFYNSQLISYLSQKSLILPQNKNPIVVNKPIYAKKGKFFWTKIHYSIKI